MFKKKLFNYLLTNMRECEEKNRYFVPPTIVITKWKSDCNINNAFFGYRTLRRFQSFLPLLLFTADSIQYPLILMMNVVSLTRTAVIVASL